MGRLASISASPMLREFAVGAAQQNINPVADYLAPTVDVANMAVRYKIYTEKSRFRIPDSRRSLNGRATRVGFDAGDAQGMLNAHALDYPIDNLETMEEAALENAAQEGAMAVAEIGGLIHERDVISAAQAAVSVTTSVNVNASGIDLVQTIDTYILSVLKAAKYGSIMGIKLLFGANAAMLFKNHPSVLKRFTVMVGNKPVIPATSQPQDISGLFLGNPDVRVSYMVYDSAQEGQAENINFVLDNEVLVFASRDAPTRRDPSFMKTLRLMGRWMVPGAYETEDGRGEVLKFDWNELVLVSNPSACARIALTLS